MKSSPPPPPRPPTPKPYHDPLAVTPPQPSTPPAQAAASLAALYGDRVYMLCLRLTGREADARDAVQEVFLLVLRKWHTFRGASQPGTWLYTLAVRLCRARLRRERRHRSPPLSDIAPWRDSSILALPDSSDSRTPTPLAHVLQQEADARIHHAILELPPAFRVPLILREMLELSVDDTAAALALKPDTVKTRVHRARLMLRAALLRSRRLPTTAAPTPTYERQVCFDLLAAKLAAMDQGRGFPLGQDVLCRRCRAVFAELDLAQNTCARLAEASMPHELRTRLQRLLGASTLPPPRRSRTARPKNSTAPHRGAAV